MAVDIQIYNTLTGRKEPFTPLTAGEVRIYACGVTTYDHYHIGHALQAIYFDVIRNYFEYAGYKVTYVRNYTDVDDKIIARAEEKGISPAKLARDIIASSEEDMTALGCRNPTHSPKVSESIDDIIAMVEELIANNSAYPTSEGDVYYRVREKPDYGKLSNRNIDDLRCGTREIAEGEKEDPLDFALWKADTTKDASWPSPWGQGRPGWHIECSAMAKRYLGEHFDIHGGGRDLVFPHHENEIAQSESANKCKYVNYWMHNGLLTIEKQKMSKSLGNHISVKDFIKKWPAESLRLAYLQHQYRSNIDFQQDTFMQAHKRLYYYYFTLAGLDEIGAKALPDASGLVDGFDPEEVRRNFHNAMSDDFNTCEALGSLNKAFKQANELFSMKKSPAKHATAKAYAAVLREVFQVFGMLQQDPNTFVKKLRTMILPQLGIEAERIEELMTERKSARAAKDFERADQIRDELAQHSIELMDTPDGTDWKIKYDG